MPPAVDWCDNFADLTGGPPPAPTPTPGNTLISIKVTPANINLANGATQQYTATGYKYNGSTQDLTSLAAWASSNVSFASINSGGFASAISSGVTTISASYGGLSGSTSLTVNLNFSITNFSPGSGAPLSSLTITGVNFPTAPGLAIVKVCGIVATVLSVTSTQIVVSVPGMAASSNCPITVTTVGGTATAKNLFTVFISGPHVASLYFTEAGIAGATGLGYVKTVAKTGGTVFTLASNLNDPVRITLDSNVLYFTEYSNPSNGSFSRISVNGGLRTNLGGASGNIFDLAANATDLYWTEYNLGQSLLKIPNAGGASSIIANLGAGGALAVTLDSNYVYWATPSTINKKSLSGGANILLATDPVGTYNANITALTTDSINVYYIDGRGADPTLTGLKKVSVAGGTVTTLIPGLPGTQAYGMINDGANVYWTNGTSIHKLVIATGIDSILVPTINNYASGLAQDANYIYYPDGASIQQLNKVSNVVTTLATGLDNPSCVAVDP